MIVQLGNVSPIDDGADDTSGPDIDAPCVTYVNLNDYSYDPATVVDSIKMELYDAITGNDGVTSMPGNEALLALTHPGGVWAAHSEANPSWVWSDDSTFATLLGDFYSCPVGIPVGLEATHYTLAGPPGVYPGDALDMTMQITADGRNMVARALGGGASMGLSGVSTTAPGATAYTLDGKTTTLNQYVGQRIICGSTSVGCVWGNIVSSTAATPGVLTVDRWYNAATPGGVAATTPVAGPYAIIDGSSPGWFVGLSTGNTTTNIGTSGYAYSPANLAGASGTAEIITSNGGLIRQVATFAHTASPASQTWTLTPIFTANASDSLPVTVQSYGVFNSMVVGDTTGTMLYYNTFGAATLSAIGDNLTLTITITTT